MLYSEVDMWHASHLRALLLTLLKNSSGSGCKVSDIFQKMFWKPAIDIVYQEKQKKFYVLDRVWSSRKTLIFFFLFLKG